MIEVPHKKKQKQWDPLKRTTLNKKNGSPLCQTLKNGINILKNVSDGYVQPDHMGHYSIGSGKKNRKLKEMEGHMKEIEACEKQVEAREKQIALREQKGPILKQVTPVAQALEIAKSDI